MLLLWFFSMKLRISNMHKESRISVLYFHSINQRERSGYIWYRFCHHQSSSRQRTHKALFCRQYKTEGYHSLVYGFGKKNPNSLRSQIIRNWRQREPRKFFFFSFFFFFYILPVCDGGHHDLNSYYSINQNVQIFKMCAIIEKHCIGCKLFW